MGDQVMDRDIAEALICQLEVGQIFGHRRIEIDIALLDQLHDGRGRGRLPTEPVPKTVCGVTGRLVPTCSTPKPLV